MNTNNDQPPIDILVIVASTRPGRRGRTIGDWVIDELTERPGVHPTMADLPEVALPFLDEPHHPSEGNYQHEHTKRWSAMVAAADAFVFVVPEYNRSMPATLKNALDFLYVEWQHKPAAFVSYSGGVSGGTRSVEMTKQVLTTLAMFPLPNMINLPRIEDHIDADRFVPPGSATEAIHEIADTLATYAGSTSALRT